MARAVGTNVRRKDGDAKVTGAAKYIDDLTFPGMLYGATVRSTIPRGKITARRVSLPRTVAMFYNCGVPLNAAAVAVNVTAISPTGSGTISVYPTSYSSSSPGA